MLCSDISYADQIQDDFKKNIIENCSVAKELSKLFHGQDRVDIVNYLAKVATLNPEENINLDFPVAIGGGNNNYNILVRDELVKTFEPQKEINAIKCSLDVLAELTPESLSAIPQVITIFENKRLLQQDIKFKGYFEDILRTIILNSIHNDNFSFNERIGKIFIDEYLTTSNNEIKTYLKRIFIELGAPFFRYLLKQTNQYPIEKIYEILNLVDWEQDEFSFIRDTVEIPDSLLMSIAQNYMKINLTEQKNLGHFLFILSQNRVKVVMDELSSHQLVIEDLNRSREIAHLLYKLGFAGKLIEILKLASESHNLRDIELSLSMMQEESSLPAGFLHELITSILKNLTNNFSLSDRAKVQDAVFSVVLNHKEKLGDSILQYLPYFFALYGSDPVISNEESKLTQKLLAIVPYNTAKFKETLSVMLKDKNPKITNFYLLAAGYIKKDSKNIITVISGFLDDRVEYIRISAVLSLMKLYGDFPNQISSLYKTAGKRIKSKIALVLASNGILSKDILGSFDKELGMYSCDLQLEFLRKLPRDKQAKYKNIAFSCLNNDMTEIAIKALEYIKNLIKNENKLSDKEKLTLQDLVSKKQLSIELLENIYENYRCLEISEEIIVKTMINELQSNDIARRNAILKSVAELKLSSPLLIDKLNSIKNDKSASSKERVLAAIALEKTNTQNIDIMQFLTEEISPEDSLEVFELVLELSSSTMQAIIGNWLKSSKGNQKTLLLKKIRQHYNLFYKLAPIKLIEDANNEQRYSTIITSLALTDNTDFDLNILERELFGEFGERFLDEQFSQTGISILGKLFESTSSRYIKQSLKKIFEKQACNKIN